MALVIGIIQQTWMYVIPLVIGYLLALFVTKKKRNENEALQNDETDARYAFPDSVPDLATSKFQKAETDANDLQNDVYETEDHIPYIVTRYSENEMVEKSKNFYEDMNRRRTLRFFSDEPVPRSVIDNIIRTAGTSPSGAHTEPWTYVVVQDLKTKKRIREIIEEEEEINYRRRMGVKWVDDLTQLGTTWEKPYLDVAPYLVILLKQSYGIGPNGTKKTHYYNEISASISAGLFLAAVQNVGLVTLTSTPLNAGPKLRELLNRPVNEKVMLLMPVGYPATDATVPNLKRKPLEDIMAFV